MLLVGKNGRTTNGGSAKGEAKLLGCGIRKAAGAASDGKEAELRVGEAR